jgi:hypothetical protein
MIDLRSSSEGYSRPFSPAAQFPLRCHQENQSWGMSQPNSVDWLMQSKLIFVRDKKKQNKLPRP